jgi:acyl-CoA thioesterase
MVDLTRASTPDAAFRLDVPAGWRQGRGAFGGLCVAAMIRAARMRTNDPARAVRSVTAELFAPVDAGPAALEVEILRHGNAVSAVRVAIVQTDVRAHAVVLLGAARGVDVAWQDLVAPEAPPWRTLAAAPNFGWPEFAANFEYRIVAGIPTTAGEAVTVGWVRAREPGAARDAGAIAALIDAWYPAALVRLPAMRPMATIAYTLDVIGSLDGLDPEAPLLYRGRVPVCRDGYFVEARELWGEDGRLIALNHQTFAIIQ